MEGQCHSRGGSTYFAFWRCMVFWILDMVYAGVQSPLGSAYESIGYGKDVTRILTSQARRSEELPQNSKRPAQGPGHPTCIYERYMCSRRKNHHIAKDYSQIVS
jgi:hypothetical protein